MADLVTVKFRLQYAVGGDYQSLPLAVDYGSGLDLVSAVPTKFKTFRESVPTIGLVVSTGDFTTITQAVIHNTDATNYVTATWQSAGLSNSQRIPPLAPLLLPGLDAANISLTSNTAPCICALILFGT